MTRFTAWLGLGPAFLVLVAPACTAHLFSGIQQPDNSRPVMRIETRGGIEYGVGTDWGILMLGRSATEGPCRVHYLLGPTPVIEDGTVVPAGGTLFRADIDLTHQRAGLLTRGLTAEDEPFLLLLRGGDVDEVAVTPAGPPAAGDLLDHPGVTPPPGTGVFVRAADGGLLLAGLVAAEFAVTAADGSTRRYLNYAGPNRLLELALTPRLHPPRERVVHRADDISVRREVPTLPSDRR